MRDLSAVKSSLDLVCGDVPAIMSESGESFSRLNEIMEELIVNPSCVDSVGYGAASAGGSDEILREAQTKAEAELDRTLPKLPEFDAVSKTSLRDKKGDGAASTFRMRLPFVLAEGIAFFEYALQYLPVFRLDEAPPYKPLFQPFDHAWRIDLQRADLLTPPALGACVHRGCNSFLTCGECAPDQPNPSEIVVAERPAYNAVHSALVHAAPAPDAV